MAITRPARLLLGLVVTAAAVIAFALISQRLPLARLDRAIRLGDLAQVRSIVGSGTRGRPFTDPEWSQILCKAIDISNEDMLNEMLLLRPAPKLDFLLYRAIVATNSNICINLLARGADANAVSLSKEMRATPLIYAAALGDAQTISVLLEHGADMGAVDHEGFTALLHAIRSRSKEKCRVLLAAGADVNAPSRDGLEVYPIIMAAVMGDASIMRLLYDRGAQVGAVSGTADGRQIGIEEAARRSGDTGAIACAEHLIERARAAALNTDLGQATDEGRAVAAAVNIMAGQYIDTKHLGYMTVTQANKRSGTISVSQVERIIGLRARNYIPAGSIITVEDIDLPDPGPQRSEGNAE